MYEYSFFNNTIGGDNTHLDGFLSGVGRKINFDMIKVWSMGQQFSVG